MGEPLVFTDTDTGIEMFRLLSIRGRLKLEMRGIKFRGGSTFSAVKRMYNLRGNKAKVYSAFCAKFGLEE